MQVEYVVLVNQEDRPLGTLEKMEAHERGVLHRAFSVFVFNKSGELMLQKRAEDKYHSPGLWTNTVCSHPRLNEAVIQAAHRRLLEEMGFDCELKKIFSFLYKADVGDGLTEHEFDHVFFGTSDDLPNPNPEEVGEWKYMPLEEVIADVSKHPEEYTVWFKIALKQVAKHVESQDAMF
ncbi:MAG: isopentenyl-diphosphate delta-isomerase [Bacteroidetes bacterium GWF2_41_31]|nr:MAG: isopentenyl-diphosphate delta-isomerase [Bacteroidetes bacterium GWF2_41_31]